MRETLNANLSFINTPQSHSVIKFNVIKSTFMVNVIKRFIMTRESGRTSEPVRRLVHSLIRF